MHGRSIFGLKMHKNSQSNPSSEIETFCIVSKRQWRIIEKFPKMYFNVNKMVRGVSVVNEFVLQSGQQHELKFQKYFELE